MFRVQRLITGLSILLILAGLLLQFYLILNPFPIGYREGASYLTTHLILQGINPFDFSNQPQDTNLYGIFYSLVICPFALIFGNSLALHRFLNLIFAIISILIIVKAINISRAQRWIKLYLAAIVYISLIMTMGVEARPDFLGFLLYVASILIPGLDGFKNRSLIIGGGLSILSFYTKIYYIIGFPLVLIFIFLFINKRTALIFGLGWLIIYALTVFAINHIFESYFANVFFSMAGYNAVKLDFIFVLKQLFFYSIRNIGILAIFVYTIYELIRERKLKRPVSFSNAVNLRDLNAPLLSHKMDYHLFIFIVTALVFITKLGHNRGSYLDYFIQLSSVFLILFSLNSFATFSGYNKLRIFTTMLLIGILSLGFFFTKNKLLKINKSGEWENLLAYTTTSGNILNDPFSTSILVDQGKHIYQSGHSYFNHVVDLNQVFSKTPMSLKNRYMRRINSYESDIINHIKTQQFDMIISSKANEFLPYNELLKYYLPVDTLDLTTFLSGGSVDILIRRNSQESQ